MTNKQEKDFNQSLENNQNETINTKGTTTTTEPTTSTSLDTLADTILKNYTQNQEKRKAAEKLIKKNIKKFIAAGLTPRKIMRRYGEIIPSEYKEIITEKFIKSTWKKYAPESTLEPQKQPKNQPDTQTSETQTAKKEKLYTLEPEFQSTYDGVKKIYIDLDNPTGRWEVTKLTLKPKDKSQPDVHILPHEATITWTLGNAKVKNSTIFDIVSEDIIENATPIEGKDYYLLQVVCKVKVDTDNDWITKGHSWRIYRKAKTEDEKQN